MNLPTMMSLLESNPVLPGGFFQAYNVIGKETIDLLRHGSHMASTGH